MQDWGYVHLTFLNPTMTKHEEQESIGINQLLHKMVQALYAFSKETQNLFINPPNFDT